MVWTPCHCLVFQDSDQLLTPRNLATPADSVSPRQGGDSDAVCITRWTIRLTLLWGSSHRGAATPLPVPGKHQEIILKTNFSSLTQ